MSNTKHEREYRVLVIDDDTTMTEELAATVAMYNEGTLPIPQSVSVLVQSAKCRFHIEVAGKVEEAEEKLLEGGSEWDIFVIDRKFDNTASGGYEWKDLYILEALRDLAAPGLRIVWTAHPNVAAAGDPDDVSHLQIPNVIQCMRLGTWDYLDKKRPRYRSTFTDVIVSMIEGLCANELLRARMLVDMEGSRFVREHFASLAIQFSGSYVAFVNVTPGQWRVLASDRSLVALYRKIAGSGQARAETHVALFPLAGPVKPETRGAQ